MRKTNECSCEKLLEAYLALQALVVGHQGRELAGLVQPRPQQSGDLLDNSLTGQEGAVLLGCDRAQPGVRTGLTHCVWCVERGEGGRGS